MHSIGKIPRERDKFIHRHPPTTALSLPGTTVACTGLKEQCHHPVGWQGTSGGVPPEMLGELQLFSSVSHPPAMLCCHITLPYKGQAWPIPADFCWGRWNKQQLSPAGMEENQEVNLKACPQIIIPAVHVLTQALTTRPAASVSQGLPIDFMLVTPVRACLLFCGFFWAWEEKLATCAPLSLKP